MKEAGSTRAVKGIQLEHFKDQFEAEYRRILERYGLRSSLPVPARMYTRNVAIFANEHKASDDHLTEFLMGDRVVATIYARRNDYNTVDMYVSCFGQDLLDGT